MVRVRRPTLRTSPAGPCRIVTFAASQASRRAVSAQTWMPPASSSADWPLAAAGTTALPARAGSFAVPAAAEPGLHVPAGTYKPGCLPPASRAASVPLPSPATVSEADAFRLVASVSASTCTTT